MGGIAGLQVHIRINGMVVQRCPLCRITYDRYTTTSYGMIDVPDPDGALARRVAPGQPVAVRFGYRAQAAREWRGVVDAWQPGIGQNHDQITVQVLGPEFVPFIRTRITESYLEEPADVLARLMLARTGCPLGTVEVPALPIHRFTLCDVPVWQAMEQLARSCTAAHGQDMRRHALWLDDAGAVHYGPHDDEAQDAAGTMPVIATGAGLIAHHPATSPKARSSVETFLLPAIRDGRLFRLRDARRGVDAVLRAVRVEHRIEPHKARTWVSYGGEYERF